MPHMSERTPEMVAREFDENQRLFERRDGSRSYLDYHATQKRLHAEALDSGRKFFREFLRAVRATK
jgi:hypothetical protein